MNPAEIPAIVQVPDDGRGIRYADGGVGWGTLAYPDPERVAAHHAFWAGKEPDELHD